MATITVWIASFWPGSSSAIWGVPVAGCAMAAVFPVFFVTVWDAKATHAEITRRTWLGSFPLHGWRAMIACALGVFAFVSFFSAVAAGGVSGQATEKGGRYYDNNHGEVTEITEAQWQRGRTGQSRMMSGHLILFSGIAALYLTQRNVSGRPDHSDGES